MQKYIGRIIYALRKGKGMRQSELASLTGLKQPNLSRIENGLVEPRRATLERIAKALDVDVSELFDERRLEELELKLGHSIGFRPTSLRGAMKVPLKTVTIPVFETDAGYEIEFDENNEPTGRSEISVVLPVIEGKCFGVRVYGDSMEAKDGPDCFRHGEVVVFSDRPSPRPGDYAFIRTVEMATFKQVFFDEECVRMVPLNRAYQEKTVKRNGILRMWKLVRHIRHFG